MCQNASKLSYYGGMQMYFRLFNENGLHVLSVDLCEDIDNLIYTRPIIYQQSWNTSACLFGRLQECRSRSGGRKSAEIAIENLDRINGNARWKVSVADDQGRDFVFAGRCWR